MRPHSAYLEVLFLLGLAWHVLTGYLQGYYKLLKHHCFRMFYLFQSWIFRNKQGNFGKNGNFVLLRHRVIILNESFDNTAEH